MGTFVSRANLTAAKFLLFLNVAIRRINKWAVSKTALTPIFLASWAWENDATDYFRHYKINDF